MSINLGNSSPILTLTMLLKGVLNQMMLRCLFLRIICLTCASCAWVKMSLHMPKAAFYQGYAVSSTVFNCTGMRSVNKIGSYLMIIGSWFECLFMSSGSPLGFL